MAIRLARFGAKKKPAYRVVVIDKRQARNSRSIEIVGHYNPTRDPILLSLDRERIEYWVGKGAQASDTVSRLLKYDPSQVVAQEQPAARPPVEERIAAEAPKVEEAPTAEATTADAPKADEAAAEAKTDEAPAEDAKAADAPKAEEAAPADAKADDAPAAEAKAADAPPAEEKAEQKEAAAETGGKASAPSGDSPE